MQRIEYSTIDKTLWTDGPWKNEPDKIQFLDEATGYPCLIRRVSHSGHLCGYVGVPSSHRFFGADYDADLNLEVHGGLTFASKCRDGEESEAICHKVEPGEDDNIWWFGFDCAHYQDLCPAPTRISSTFRSGVYRDLAFVQAECASLAQQLKKASEL